MTTNRIEFGIWSWKVFVSPAGSRKKRPMANRRAKTIVPAHAPPPISAFSPDSSAGIWAFAEIPSARKPILSDSTRAATPRITGTRRIRWRLVQETSGSEITSISPFAPSFESEPPAASCRPRACAPPPPRWRCRASPRPRARPDRRSGRLWWPRAGGPARCRCLTGRRSPSSSYRRFSAAPEARRHSR